MMVTNRKIAGLHAHRLIGLLEKKKIFCEVMEDDSQSDHCIFRITSHKFSNIVLYLEYENQGHEPRILTLYVYQKENEPDFEKYYTEEHIAENSHMKHIKGSIEKDPEKIVEWLVEVLVEYGI